MNIKNLLFSARAHPALRDFSLLAFRVFSGAAMLTHGYPKLQKILSGDLGFPDPIGLGPALSLYLVTFAEFACVILLILGFFTRLSTLPLIFAMFVAAFIYDGANETARELAIMYMASYTFLFFMGPGRVSIDYFITRRKAEKKT
ncbi:MAG: DoxX family protein [Bradymonadales bacterium]